METIALNWLDFKNFVTARSASLQFIEFDQFYQCWAVDGPMSITTKLNKDGNSDTFDFEANFKASGNVQLSYRSTDGLPKVANAMFTDAASYWVDGASGQMTISPNQTGYVKTHFPTNFKLSGVDVHWSGSNFGDHIDFEIGVYNGDSTNETNFIPLAQFANEYRIMGEGTKMFEVSTVKIVPSTYNSLDVYIRTTYVNSGSSEVSLLVNLLGYK